MWTQGPDSYYGTKGQRKVTHDIVAHDTASSGKVTFQFTYATGNNNGTSVEDGQIPEFVLYAWQQSTCCICGIADSLMFAVHIYLFRLQGLEMFAIFLL